MQVKLSANTVICFYYNNLFRVVRVTQSYDNSVDTILSGIELTDNNQFKSFKPENMTQCYICTTKVEEIPNWVSLSTYPANTVFIESNKMDDETNVVTRYIQTTGFDPIPSKPVIKTWKNGPGVILKNGSVEALLRMRHMTNFENSTGYYFLEFDGKEYECPIELISAIKNKLGI